jgi:hypothetical protein
VEEGRKIRIRLKNVATEEIGVMQGHELRNVESH